MYTLLLTAFIAASAVASPVQHFKQRQVQNTTAPDGSEILFCNGKPFRKTAYNCWNGFLCPIINFTDYLQCGDACYNPFVYACLGGQLQQLYVVAPSNATASPAACDSGLVTSTLTIAAGATGTGTAVGTAVGTGIESTITVLATAAPNITNACS